MILKIGFYLTYFQYLTSYYNTSFNTYFNTWQPLTQMLRLFPQGYSPASLGPILEAKPGLPHQSTATPLNPLDSTCQPIVLNSIKSMYHALVPLYVVVSHIYLSPYNSRNGKVFQCKYEHQVKSIHYTMTSKFQK